MRTAARRRRCQGRKNASNARSAAGEKRVLQHAPLLGGELAALHHEARDRRVQLGRVLRAHRGKELRQRREVAAHAGGAAQEAGEVVAAHETKITRLRVIGVRVDRPVQDLQPLAQVAQLLRGPERVLGAQGGQRAAVRRERGVQLRPGLGMQTAAQPLDLRHPPVDRVAVAHAGQVQLPQRRELGAIFGVHGHGGGERERHGGARGKRRREQDRRGAQDAHGAAHGSAPVGAGKTPSTAGSAAARAWSRRAARSAHSARAASTAFSAAPVWARRRTLS